MPIDRVTLDDLEATRRPGSYRMTAVVDAGPAADLPLMVIAGERPGPVFVAAAGVHGDEYEGPRALWEVCDSLPPSSLSGVFVALPICNPWAFAAGSRTTPAQLDGVNLARTFPGDPAGSPTQRLAAALLGFIMRLRPALFVDLHSGGVRYRFQPAVGYRQGVGDTARARAGVRAFGGKNLWAVRDQPGRFNAETARRGITTIGNEMTGAGGCLDEDVAGDREGVLNLMRWLGMLRDRPAPEVPGPFWEMTGVPSPAGGFAEMRRSIGDVVTDGAPIAVVRSAFGEIVGEARAPYDGAVWVTRHLRVIEAGEMIGSVARPVGAAD
ncbi:MAG TPA: succinylglutamate desuccinylase/aspartoacylase family protein [bacterium]|nr:succinylglutamate desuccinylase/aspartoacylase family protein [bacterium]